MEKGDNVSFESIVNGQLESELSKSLEVYDATSDEFYEDFTDLLSQIEDHGQFEKPVSLTKPCRALELVVNEILHQDGDFDDKAIEISGVATADTLRRENFIRERNNIHSPIDQDTINALKKVLLDMVHYLDQAGADIPRSFSLEYMKLVKEELQAMISEEVIRYHTRDK